MSGSQTGHKKQNVNHNQMEEAIKKYSFQRDYLHILEYGIAIARLVH